MPEVLETKIMSTKLKKIRITPWPGGSGIVRVPDDDIHKLKGEFKGGDALLPPFTQGDWHRNATSAAMIRGAFREHTIMAPIPAANVKEARYGLEVMNAGGFVAFCFPECPGGVPIQHKAGFWMMSGLLHEGSWYHLAGSTGEEAPADLPGFWTYSEEEM